MSIEVVYYECKHNLEHVTKDLPLYIIRFGFIYVWLWVGGS